MTLFGSFRCCSNRDRDRKRGGRERERERERERDCSTIIETCLSVVKASQRLQPYSVPPWFYEVPVWLPQPSISAYLDSYVYLWVCFQSCDAHKMAECGCTFRSNHLLPNCDIIKWGESQESMQTSKTMYNTCAPRHVQ